ncbi:MAG: penicillin-binding protein 1C, partial [Pseudolabrys sp.]
MTQRSFILRRAGAVAAVGAVAACAAFAAWGYALGSVPLGNKLEYSHVVLDREGRLLRAYATNEGRWRLPVTVKDVDPRFLRLLYAYEDKRFYDHYGVDGAALTRAAVQLATRGHIVSGGSTITMQVARLLEPREHRSLLAKLRQIVRAFELEHALGKEGVLSLYLTLAPYGGNLEGIRAASLAYFGKEPLKLSLAEAALLVALPQSPESRRPDRYPDVARAARDRVLARAASAGIVPPDEIGRAKSQPIPRERKQLPMLAPHAADQVVSREPDRRVHRLTIDLPLQSTLQDLARERARSLGADISVAILAADNVTGEVRARVASADYFDARRAGQVDMTSALRSPGSTLKPFIYGLGFEDGLIHPETLIDDIPVRYGGYTPENFDQTFQGTVTVRRALQLSLNVPAIAVLGKVGVNRLSARLSQTGAALVLPQGEAPGLAMGLGGVGVRLSDLVMLYSGLARLGAALPLSERQGTPVENPRRLLDPVAAWYIGNILIGAPSPENA